MPRRTFAQIVCDWLDQQELQQASPRRIAEGLGWDEAKVLRVVNSTDAPELQLSRGRGGVVQCRRSERFGRTGIYNDVGRVLRDYWADRRGLRDIEIHTTARSGRRLGGAWVHPDLVMLANPRRRRSASDPRDIYSLEVETAGGFDIKSVYQAHAAGRGATYSWVVFSRTDKNASQWERIDWAARQLGIGMIEFGKPGSFTTWKVLLEADRRTGDPEDRENFINTVLRPQGELRSVA